MPSRTRPQPQTAAQIARRLDACNAFSDLSQTAHYAATAALMSAPPAMLAAAEQLPAVASEPETGTHGSS